MKELEDEMRKMNTLGGINVKILTKATSIVNEKVRHQGLSAKEILFSRDQFSQANLALDDEAIALDKMEKREEKNVANAKSQAKLKTPSIPANAIKGQIIFLKHEITKHSKREMYIVLETDATTQTHVISKLPHALSGNTPITFQPQNFNYHVKQTDVILSPNQPTFSECYEEVEYSDEYYFPLDQPRLQPSKPQPHYPYDCDDDDDLVDEFMYYSDDDQSINSTYEDSFSEALDDLTSDHSDDADADDERTGELQSIDVTYQDNSEHGGAAANLDEPQLRDQTRQPKKGDIIRFVKDDVWVTAKIQHKAKSSNFYNVELEDGSQLGLQLNPPSADLIQSWSLLPQDYWNPEQFRHADPDSSINLSNLETLERDDDFSIPISATNASLQLHLLPEQNIEFGQVYNLSDSVIELQIPSTGQTFKLERKDYDKRYEKALKILNLPPEQKHMEKGMANFLILDQLYSESNSPMYKLKSLFNCSKLQ